MANIEPDENRLVAVLEDKRFRWRTATGLARDTGWPMDRIRSTLAKLAEKNVVVRSTVPSRTSEELFTTRRHFKETASFTDRLRVAFRNRID